MKLNRSHSLKKGEGLVSELLSFCGENVNRSGLQETPGRVIRMYEEVLGGYKIKIEPIFKTFDSNGYHDLVTASNIGFYSLCEHHMVPFFGKVHIGYIPNGRILGLSKFARLVEVYSRRLQTQENLTKQIADAIEKYLHPQGFIVHTQAEHLCVAMRGVKKDGFLTKTTIIRGALKKKPELLDQFYRDIYLERKSA
jgi:GTP cyclohydrolase IA